MILPSQAIYGVSAVSIYVKWLNSSLYMPKEPFGLTSTQSPTAVRVIAVTLSWWNPCCEYMHTSLSLLQHALSEQYASAQCSSIQYRDQSRYVPNQWEALFVGLRPVIQILCHVLARGWGRWLRYLTEAKAEVKYRASARIRGPKHDTRFEWPVSILIMTRHPFLPFKTHKTSAKKSSFTYDHRRHLILPLPPVHALPTLNAPTCC